MIHNFPLTQHYGHGHVPFTTKTKMKRTRNLPTERLLARRMFLIVLLKFPVNARKFQTRIEFATKAAELGYIERTLVGRGVEFTPVTVSARTMQEDQ
jgi:hypothetical protein